MHATAHVLFEPEPLGVILYGFEPPERLGVGRVLLRYTVPLPLRGGFPFDTAGGTISLLDAPGMTNFAETPSGDFSLGVVVETYDPSGAPADIAFSVNVMRFDPAVTPGSFCGSNLPCKT